VDNGRKTDTAQPKRVLFALSSGGHLAQALTLEPWWRDFDRLWVTFDTPDALSVLVDERTVWAYRPTTRHIGNLLRNSWLAWKVVRRYRPDIVISTGAGVALPFFVLAKLMRIPTCYIEVYDRVNTPTLTGRLCRPFSDLFLVQWPEQLDLYKGSVLVGRLL
jgi:UDP-N-acetylglucosamine:LPS N-acetylglucosamine transferase